MRKITLAAAIVMGLAAPQAAEAQVLPIAAGAVLGGLVGSLYVNGLSATAAGVSSATASTVGAVGAAAPAAASAAGGVIAAASAPVVLGVIAGGALGYFLLRSER